MCKEIRIIILIVGFINLVYGQAYVGTILVVNNGGVFKVSSNALVVGGSGEVNNSGVVEVDYSYINNGVTRGGVVGQGLFKIGGDWINNNEFTAYFSKIHLYNSERLISGSEITHFDELKLTGGSKVMTIDASVYLLDLGSDHLMTKENIMLVENPDPNAIDYSTGFVSSLGDGHLQRKTNTFSEYKFPLGTEVGELRLKTVCFEPQSTDDNIYGARLVNNIATSDGYDITKKSVLLQQLCPLYYYHFYHNQGTSKCDLWLEYGTEDDKYSETIAQWKTEWVELDKIEKNSGKVGVLDFEDFSTRPFVLAQKQSFIYIPNSFTPNADGINDTFHLYLDKDEFIKFEFLIFNRWGQLVFETNEVNFIWKGDYKGDETETNTYVWKLKAQFKETTEIIQKTGTVTILK